MDADGQDYRPGTAHSKSAITPPCPSVRLSPVPALVAQWIEHGSPKAGVGGSIPLGGTTGGGRPSPPPQSPQRRSVAENALVSARIGSPMNRCTIAAASPSRNGTVTNSGNATAATMSNPTVQE